MSGRTCSGKTFSAGAGAVAGQEPAAKKDEPGQVEDPQQEVNGHGKGGGGEGGQAQGGSGSGGISQARLEFIKMAMPDFAL